jgi:hypothetical protein
MHVAVAAELASWNDGGARTAILDFVAAVTTEGSADFVPEVERAAVFDNDGTLSCERPATQLAFAVDRAASCSITRRRSKRKLQVPRHNCRSARLAGDGLTWSALARSVRTWHSLERMVTPDEVAAAHRAAVDDYELAWNTRDESRRVSALERAWADNGVYVDDDVPDGVIGREALSALIATEHAETPGLVITTTRPLVLLGDRGWLQWESHSSSGTSQSGTDFVEFGPDGRIERLTDFLDAHD